MHRAYSTHPPILRFLLGNPWIQHTSSPFSIRFAHRPCAFHTISTRIIPLQLSTSYRFTITQLLFSSPTFLRLIGFKRRAQYIGFRSGVMSRTQMLRMIQSRLAKLEVRKSIYLNHGAAFSLLGFSSGYCTGWGTHVLVSNRAARDG